MAQPEFVSHNYAGVPEAHPRKYIAHLIEAVCAALSVEGFDIGVPQDIVLGSPLHHLDIAAYRQAAVLEHYQVSVSQLPEDFGWGYCRQPLRNGP